MKRLIISLFCLLGLATTTLAQELRILCEQDKPLQFKNPDGSLTGLAVEVVQEIQKRVGNTDPIHMVPWARGIKHLHDEPNTILFSMGRTAERNKLYQWVGPISETVMGLYAKADSPIQIKSLDDAKKLRAIGVYRDDLRDQFLTRAGFTNLERTTDARQSYTKLMLGRVDLFASSANEVAENRYTDMKLVFTLFKTQIFIAVNRKTDSAIVTRWNEALEAMKNDGTFKAIVHKYYPGRDLPGPAITNF